MGTSRRGFLSGSGVVGAGLLWSACKSSSAGPDNAGASSSATKPSDTKSTDAGSADGAKAEDEKDDDAEVTATEDLMREHGVLRRALVVYREAALRLRGNAAGGAGAVPLDALQKTAKMFRAFGEEYHERKLEEAFIFPAINGKSATGKGGGGAAKYTDALVAQHARGREITDYILAVTQAPKIGANAQALATVLEGFARMYEEHTAIEDTIVFPAWKETMSAKELDEMGDKFEGIEKATFGKDGFDDAVEEIAGIERALGLSDLAKFTAPPPPKPQR